MNKNKKLIKITTSLMAASLIIGASIMGTGFNSHAAEDESGSYGIFRWDDDGDGEADVRLDGDNIDYQLNKNERNINKLRDEIGLSDYISGADDIHDVTYDDNGNKIIEAETELIDGTRAVSTEINSEGTNATQTIIIRDESGNITSKKTQTLDVGENGSIVITTITYEKDVTGTWQESEKEEKTIEKDGSTTIITYVKDGNVWKKISEVKSETTIKTDSNDERNIIIYNEDGTKTIINLNKENNIVDINVIDQTVIDQIENMKESVSNTMNQATDKLTDYVDEEIKKIEKRVTDSESKVDQMSKDMTDFTGQVTKQIDDNKKDVEQQIKDFQEDVQILIKETKEEINDAFAEYKEATTKEINDRVKKAEDDMDVRLKESKEQLDKTDAKADANKKWINDHTKDAKANNNGKQLLEGYAKDGTLYIFSTTDGIEEKANETSEP